MPVDRTILKYAAREVTMSKCVILLSFCDMGRELMPTQTTRVGLVFGYSLAYCREILRGIKRFSESKPNWVFTPIAPEPEALTALKRLKHDGLIAHVFDRELAIALTRFRKPVVNVSGVLPNLKFPRVAVDHVRVGRMAADHLLDLGLRNFAFVGYDDHDFSKGRESGFCDTINRVGFTVASYHEQQAILRRDPTGLWTWSNSLLKWLHGLPHPVGILASHDIQGIQVSEACRWLGLRVPDDVAIVGVDNDDLLCELARPSLSSVELAADQIGYEAASLLNRMLAGSPPPVKPTLIPPVRVVARQSSDVLFVEDSDVKQAVRFIRTNAHRQLRVQEVLDEVRVSRRSLERRFRGILQRGISEEIRRVHLDKAKSLLTETALSVAEVAAQSGFLDTRHLSVTFRKEVGLPPLSYRRQLRGTRAGSR